MSSNAFRMWSGFSLNGFRPRIRGGLVHLLGGLALSGIINVWNLQTGTMARRLEGHSNRVYAMAVSPNGRWVLSGSGDSTLRGWEIEASGTA
jgi:WD40 repeat protein